MTNSRYANWLKTGEDEIFFWHHLPLNISKNSVVIIIGPIGPEYMSCHRSIKLLAEKIALSGFNCIRYDPIGMGNSSGNLSVNHLWDKWVNTPSHLAAHLKNKFKIDEFILIGLRSGCLVLSEVQKNLSSKNIIFWYPQMRGTKFIRSIQLLDSVLYKGSISLDSTTLEGGGYPFSEELQNSINKIDLLSSDYRHIQNAIVINSSQFNENSNLSDKLNASGAKAETAYLDGIDDMIRQVTLSRIPYSNINKIESWLNNLHIENTESVTNFQHANSSTITTTFTEHIVSIKSERNIFSILTTPIINDKNKIVVFVNTGAAHHAGPNRIHVDVAHTLAKQGISTLRIDLSNLGDSSTNYEKDPPEEYPSTAADDINIAITYLKENLSKHKIVLCGISAGAHNIFHAALESSYKNLFKIILINPETFYWKPDQSIFSAENSQIEINEIYYRKQFLNYKKWFTVIINPKKIYRTSQFLLLYSIKKIKSFFLLVLGLLNIHIKNTLENDMISLANKNIKINLIYSQSDPSYKIMMSQASRTIKYLTNKNMYSSLQIQNADHTFSSIKSRQNLYKAIYGAINKI